jgi:branched-subunit amino acid aminotransferase/4-amino-4-deoxychorismate lyase
MDYVIFNGKIVPKSEANINISDKGYFFDFAVYSSVKVIRGKIFSPEYHVDRLLESARFIDLGHQFSREEILGWLDLLVKKNKIGDALLRLVLIGDADNNREAKFYAFPITGLTYYPDKVYKGGIKVITYRGERRWPNSKTKDLLLGFLAYREAKKQGANEALLVDNDGNIREGTQSNFFAIKGDTLIRSPREKVLGGITEKIILASVAGKFKVKEEDIPLAKLKDYDEFFISSTTRNVIPIRQIDEIDVSSDFPKIKTIQKLFKDYYHEHFLE